MVNLRPGPKQGPPKIPHLHVDLVPESTWLSSGPFIGRLILVTCKDTHPPLRRLSTGVYVDISRALYWLFEPRDPKIQYLFYAHTFIIDILF